LATVNCNYLVRLLQFNIDNGTVPLFARSLCEPAFACPVFVPIALPLSAFHKAVTRDPSVSTGRTYGSWVPTFTLLPHPGSIHLLPAFSLPVDRLVSYIHRVMRMMFVRLAVCYKHCTLTQ